MSIELAKAKQILVSKIGDMLVDGDLQSFLSSVLSALSLKLEDAPSDGKQYSREDGTWSEVVIPTPDVTEAPVDGKQYVRQDADWAEVTIPASGIPEAPADGKTYGRKDADWAEITGGGGGAGTMARLDFMEGGEDAIDPAAFPYVMGTETSFIGVAQEDIAAEDFSVFGIYESHFIPFGPTDSICLQYIKGPQSIFKRMGSVSLVGNDIVADMGNWGLYSSTFSAFRNELNNYFVPNVESNPLDDPALYTVSVSNATATVTVSQGSDELLRWTPISSSDTHTFTFSSIPGLGGITIGSSGSFLITKAWLSI